MKNPGLFVGVLLLGACTAAPAPTSRPHAPAGAAQSAEIDGDTARLRTATAPFRSLDAAVAAGYPARVAQCISHPGHGAMGFHHVKAALLDDRVEVERPEILIYARLKTGEYVLNGVEYVIPYSIRPPDAEPPRIMGQALRRSDELQLWYLHVWVWKENPSGLFADWNPAVSCG